jgi:hypothetical protein
MKNKIRKQLALSYRSLICTAKKDDSNRVQDAVRMEYNKLGEIT